MNYAVIIDNGGGPNLVYHDVEGEVYTFPTSYRQYLLPGTKVVYQRSEKTDEQPAGLKRLMDEAHHFATAVIGTVETTDNDNLRATIEQFVRFQYPVPFRKPDGEHWEKAAGKFWRNGVRVTDKSVYDAIVAASKTKPVVVPVAKKGVGIRSITKLAPGIASKPFADNRFRVVTAKDGYYLHSMSDGIYYLIVNKKLSDYLNGTIQVFRSPQGSYFFRHSGYSSRDIGTLDLVEHGVVFKSNLDGLNINIKIML